MKTLQGDYLKGLLLVDTERSTAEMERRVAPVNKQQLGHFISNSPWDEELMIGEIQRSVVATINRAVKIVNFDRAGYIFA